ncbi:MAG: rRNA maturation RNase YbeY [Verrucomicrobia bacterium]|nr:rRNA maturation RNase YbeY [Verrucomicrobiota bacterium]
MLASLTMFFMGEASRRTPRCDWGEIHLVLVDDSGIAAVHAAWMDLDSATDVLTQRYDPMPGQPGAHAGEIVVNVQRAHEIGRAQWPRISPRALANGCCHELGLYVAHGCDHLTGASDATPPERRRMRARELRWLRAAAQAGLLNRLISPRGT